MHRQEEKSQETLTLCSDHKLTHHPLPRALFPSPLPTALRIAPAPPPQATATTTRARCRARRRAAPARYRLHLSHRVLAARDARARAAVPPVLALASTALAAAVRLMLLHHTPCLLTISAPPLPSSTYLCLTPTTTARTSARHSAQHALVAAGAQWRVRRMFPRGASSGHAWSILRPPVVDEVLSGFSYSRRSGAGLHDPADKTPAVLTEGAREKTEVCAFQPQPNRPNPVKHDASFPRVPRQA